MKRFILLFVIAACAYCQETLQVYHAVGGVASSTVLGEYIFSMTAAQIDLGPSEFGAIYLQRMEISPLTDSTSGSGIAIPLLTAVTGGSSSQSINVPTTEFMNQSSITYMVMDAEHPALQEVVAGIVTDSTHFSAKAFNSHAIGATVRIVYSVFTKYLSIKHSFGTASITNIGLVRYGLLPANVFEQVRVLGSVGTLDYEPDSYVPWASGSVYVPTTPTFGPVPPWAPSALSGTGNPLNALVLAAGPVTTSLSVYANPQVQFLFTSSPEVSLSGINYRVYWDH